MSTGYTFDATTLVAKMYKIWLITFVGLESCILFNHLWAGVVDMVAFTIGSVELMVRS